jgi:2-polyprenyl-3-methyl-5-hydroxy-6-metoxy-1,4-benzoquinol methylase
MTQTVTSEHTREKFGEDRASAGQTYIVPNEWEHARRRLELLEACYDEASFRRASLLRVCDGWRCLEAGAGGGSFARWLSAKVGPGGSVVAADLDTRLLGDIHSPNVEIRELDLVSGELPSQEFDFIHTRLVLMHIPERERVLDRLCAALRPGGTLMLEEADVFPILAAESGPYRDAWLAFRRAYLRW